MKKKDLIAKRGTLSQKYDKTKHGLMRRYFLIFDLGGLGFMVEIEKIQIGLILSIS